MLNKTKNGNSIEEYFEVYDAVGSSDLFDNYSKLSKRALELADSKEFLEASHVKNITVIDVKFGEKTYGELIIQYETPNEGITIHLRTKNGNYDELRVKAVLSADSVISFVPEGQTNDFEIRQRYGNRYIVDYLLEKLLERVLLFISK